MGETYAGAGVDIGAGDEAVRRIRDVVASTYRSEVVGDIGGFGAMFDIGAHGCAEPILVSATDGVGTKALVATAAGRYDTIGIDLVAMCVDDLVCTGAEPLFLLDYISVGRVIPEQMEALVGGVAEGCRRAGCALIGGEMAEHPGVMAGGEFDLVGFAVGVVDRSMAITGERVQPGDAIIGLASPGLRSNGYSLARRLYFDGAGRSLDDPAWDGADVTVEDELLRPSVIYAPAIRELLGGCDVRSVAHITGGGLPGNVPRSLPDGCEAAIDRSAWDPPPVFGELQRLGGVDDDEMARTFNLGVGMTVVVPANQVEEARAILAANDVPAWPIGEIRPT